MENASKALVMAGSILMSILVISLVVMMYGRISDIEQTKVNAEESSKQVKYIKDIEAYSKNLYGSELLSFSNLLVEYRLNQVEIKGYMPITVEVELKTAIKDRNEDEILEEGRKYTITEISSGISDLRADIEDYETKKYKTTGKTIKQFAQMSNIEIAKEYGLLNEVSNMEDYDIKDYLCDYSSKKSLMTELYKEIQKYINVKATERQFKETIFIFKADKAVFDENTGRITYILFEEYRDH